MSKRSRTIVACAAAAATLVMTVPALAQTSLMQNDWRRRDRSDLNPAPSTIWNFTFELRLGAYYPNIDDGIEASASYPCGGPYHCYFGNGAQFYFGLEIDWFPVRIPYVGRIGPALGWGFVTYSSKTHNPASDNWAADWRKDSNAVTDESTGMTLIPMHLSAVLRIDEISKRTVLPIVPYAKAGFGFGTWNSGTSQGTSKIKNGSGSEVVAEGLSFGPHLALGGMLGLNWLDPRSGALARESSGIQKAYLFGEWMFADLRNSAKPTALNIGTSTWVLGLAADF